MPYIRLELPEDVYRKLLNWAARAGEKAHTLAEQELIKLINERYSNGPQSKAS